MILHAYFAITKRNPLPQIIVSVDGATIDRSESEEKDFLAHYEEQAIKAINASGDEYENGGWYRVSLPDTIRGRVAEDLRDVTPTFQAQSVKASPKEVQHPSIQGITVTVGREPGKIKDDEIINL